MNVRKDLSIRLAVFVLVPALVLAVAVPAAAVTHYVSLGQSIHAAINAASNGDEIEVSRGTYYEAINFNGKAVRLYSSGGPDVTTIDANGIIGAYHVIKCVSGENANTFLEGFTITGGNPTNGGGIYNSGSSPPVNNCTFRANPSFATDAYARTDSRKPHVAFASQDIRVVPAEKVLKALLAPSAKKTFSIIAAPEKWLTHVPWTSLDIFSACLPAHARINPAIRGPPSNAKHL